MMKTSQVRGALALLVVCSFYPAAHAANSATKKIRTIPTIIPHCATNIVSHLNILKAPGMSAGIIKNGELKCTAVAGMANISENRPVSPNTLFAWASVSKTVSATAMMILFDEGKFQLDDDINKYLPFSTRNPHCPATPITFRQLLTHTSSITDSEDYDNYYTIGDSPISIGEYVRGYVTPGSRYYNANNFGRRCPGTKAEYSNVAVGLLGYLVEQISGMSFDEFCRQRITVPLGMSDASFLLAKVNVNNVAMPYDGRPGNYRAHGHNGYPTLADGTFRASVPDMARFLVMNAELGIYNGRRILAESTVNEMRRRQVPSLDANQGLIWFYDSKGRIGHDGSDPGTGSLMAYDPVDRSGVLLVGNGEWNEADANRVLELLFNESKNY